MNQPNDTAQGSPAVQAAAAAAEAIRQLNHETLPGKNGLQYPADAYAVIGALALAAERLPQALSQVSGWLWSEDAAGRVGLDCPGSAMEQVTELRTELAEAQSLAGFLADALRRAHSLASHLTGQDAP